MNDTFNLVRFGLLFKKTLLERPLQIVGGFVLAILITWVFYSALKNVGTEWLFAQKEDFSIGLILGGGYLAATIFAYFSDNANGYSYMTLPVSAFEKWLCGLLIMAGFTLFYLCCFRIIDTTYVTLYHNSLDPTKHSYQQDYNHAYILPFDSPYITYIYKIYFSLTGFMALSALYFNKNVVVKGVVSFFIICFAGNYVNTTLAKSFFADEYLDTRPFYHVIDRANKMYAVMPENWLQIINPFFLIGLPLILWLVALIRLREKEF